MGKPKLADSHFASAFDAASYMYSTWLTGSRFQQGGVTRFEAQWGIATAASLTLYISDTSLGTTAYGLILAQGSTTINKLHSDVFNLKASQYFNFKWGVTTTLNWMTVTERVDW